MKVQHFLTLMCVLCLSHAASGAITVSTETVIESGGTEGDPYTPIFPSGGSSMVDVLNGFLPTALNGDDLASGTGGVTVLTDGSIDNFWGNGTPNDFHTSYIGGGNSHVTEVTYSLGNSYDLTEIVIYGGWGDSGRDEQKADVSYSTDGINFTSFGATLGGQEAGGDPINHRNSITDTSGTLMTDVVALRFNFIAAENGWSGYAEIDAFGTSNTVPGDADGNGVVNILDFYVISDNFLSATSVAGTDGDINFDNIVDQKDFRKWREISGAGISAASAVVPEPASITLIGSCVVMGLGVMRRRS